MLGAVITGFIVRNAQIESLLSYPDRAYDGVDLTGLSAFTIRWLQDRNIPTTFENVVVASFKMFPGKFSLEGYSEFPDAARIGRTLLQLGPKYRNWARGSVQKGFVLTQSGLAKVEQVARRLEQKEDVAAPLQRRSSLPRTMDMAKELDPLETSPLYQKWTLGHLQEATSLELLNMLDAYAYTPPRALSDRLSVLENAARQSGRDNIATFLKAVRKTFAAQLRDRKDG